MIEGLRKLPFWSDPNRLWQCAHSYPFQRLWEAGTEAADFPPSLRSCQAGRKRTLRCPERCPTRHDSEVVT